MQKVKENKIFIILVLILSSICFFYINQKQGFHEDEIFSYGSSNYKYDNVFRSYGYAQANYAYLYTNLLQVSPLNQIKNFWHFLFSSQDYEQYYDPVLKAEVPTWQDQSQALEYLTIQKEDIFNFFSVWFNQLQDVHPPLFYFLVHLFSSFSLNHFSKYPIFFLNLFFFFGTLLVLYKTILLFAKKNWANLGVVLYGLSMGAISTVMFQRMYMMLTFFTILYLYYTLKFFKNKKHARKDYFLWGLCICLGFLTQYYFAIFVVATFLVMALFLLKKKDYQTLRNVFFTHALGALVGILFFPSSIEDIFFSYRGLGGAQDKTKTTIEMLIYFLKTFFTSFSIPIIFGSILIILGIIWLFWKQAPTIKKIKSEKTFWFLIIPFLLVLLLVSKLSPFLGERYTSRYIMFLLPVFVLLIIYFLSHFKAKYLYLSSVIIVALISLNGLVFHTPTYLYKENAQVLELAQKYQNDSLIYIYDNYFTHLSSLPEFLKYQKTLIINHNIYDFTSLQSDEYLQSQSEIILCIKNWLNTEELLNKVLANTHFTKAELLLSLTGEVEANYYKLSV